MRRRIRLLPFVALDVECDAGMWAAVRESGPAFLGVLAADALLAVLAGRAAGFAVAVGRAGCPRTGLAAGRRRCGRGGRLAAREGGLTLAVLPDPPDADGDDTPDRPTPRQRHCRHRMRTLLPAGGAGLYASASAAWDDEDDDQTAPPSIPTRGDN